MRAYAVTAEARRDRDRSMNVRRGALALEAYASISRWVSTTVRAADETPRASPARHSERELSLGAHPEGYRVARQRAREKQPTSATARRAREAAATEATRDRDARR